jgi:hypothetical protein
MTSAAVAEVGMQQLTPAQIRAITFIKRWVALFGEPPRAADLNPSAARNSGQEWRIARYAAGDPETGEPFMALNSLKKPFDGSLNKAIVAAGFAPAKPGPPRRAEVRGREVDVDRLGLHPQVRAALEAAQADARAAAAKLQASDRRLAEARDRAARDAAALAASRAENARLRERLERRAAVKAEAAAPKVVRQRVVDDAAVRRAREQADRAVARAAAKAEAAREGEREAKTTATRLASRLERAEATINAVRAEKAQLRAELSERERDADRVVAAERQAADLREQLAALRERPPVVRSADREAVELAELEQEATERRAREAEVRAARAERELRETVALLKGQARRLTAAEVEDLRTEGPAGPSMLARAIEGVVRARRAGNPDEIRQALRSLSQASETYRDRL